MAITTYYCYLATQVSNNLPTKVAPAGVTALQIMGRTSQPPTFQPEGTEYLASSAAEQRYVGTPGVPKPLEEALAAGGKVVGATVWGSARNNGSKGSAVCTVGIQLPSVGALSTSPEMGKEVQEWLGIAQTKAYAEAKLATQKQIEEVQLYIEAVKAAKTIRAYELALAVEVEPAALDPGLAMLV